MSRNESRRHLVAVLTAQCFLCVIVSCSPHGSSRVGVTSASQTKTYSNRTDGIVISDTRSGGMIENGSAYDKASLDIRAYRGVIIPTTAQVEQGQKDGAMEVFIEKTLAHHGVEHTKVSIRDECESMGCVYRVENNKLALATFGEFTHKEGGSYMRLLLRISPGVAVERRDDLSGPPAMRNRVQPEAGTDGWHKLETVPDTALTARGPHKGP